MWLYCSLLSRFFIYNIYLSFNSFWYLRLLLFRIKSQPGVAYKCAIKKLVTFCSLLFMKKYFSLMSLFLCLSSISLGRYVKSGSLKQKICRGESEDEHEGGLPIDNSHFYTLCNIVRNEWPGHFELAVTNLVLINHWARVGLSQ